MSPNATTMRCKATLHRPAKLGADFSAFLVLPRSVSEKLPRRGRTSVDVTLNGH